MDATVWLLIIGIVAVIAAPFVTLSAVSSWRARRPSNKATVAPVNDKQRDDDDSSDW